MTKLTQMEFYNVGTGRTFKAKKDDIDVVKMKNKKIKGGVPALRAWHEKSQTYFYKFIKPDSYQRMVDKFGKGRM
jgi:hypothetical protein